MNVLLALLLLPLSNIAAWSQTVTTANLGANQVTLQITSAAAGLGSFTVLQGDRHDLRLDGTNRRGPRQQ